MEKPIVSKLREIEEKEKVRILLAVESGSRAWVRLPGQRLRCEIPVDYSGVISRMSSKLIL